MTTNTVAQQEQVKQSSDKNKDKDKKKERFINPVDGTLVTGGRKQYHLALAGAR